MLEISFINNKIADGLCTRSRHWMLNLRKWLHRYIFRGIFHILRWFIILIAAPDNSPLIPMNFHCGRCDGSKISSNRMRYMFKWKISMPTSTTRTGANIFFSMGTCQYYNQFLSSGCRMILSFEKKNYSNFTHLNHNLAHITASA